MTISNTNKNTNEVSAVQSLFISNEAMEIVVIEEKKLINMLFGKTLQSAIERICNLKNFPIKFLSFQTELDLINYIENKEFGKTNMIVFSDNSLDKITKNSDILVKIKQKGIDLKMIVMSETTNNQTANIQHKNQKKDINSKYNTIPAVSSQIIEKIVINHS